MSNSKIVKAFTITRAEYYEFLTDYDQKGLYPDQRLGQAFCNKYNLTDPTLFYQTNNFLASDAISRVYVENNTITL